MTNQNQKWDLRIGLGTASFIPHYGLAYSSRAEEPQKVLDKAVQDGVRYFDTSPAYQNAETALGNMQLNRSLYEVITKISPANLTDEAKAFAEVEGSLSRLNGKINGLLIHNATAMQIQDPLVLKMMRKIQDRFGIEWIGASTYGTQDALVANDSAWCQILQFEGSVLNSSVIQTLATVKKRSVQWVCRSVLTQGLLAGVPPKITHPRLETALKRFFEYAKEWGYSPVALAILYVLSYSWIDHVILGAANLNEWSWIQEASQKSPLKFSQVEKLKELNLSELDAVHPLKWL